jgi:PilZ domain
MRMSTPPLSALLLCDVPATAENITRVLEFHGFTVSRPVDAIEARKNCERTRFDFAVYDQDSPAAFELGANPPRSRPHVMLKLATPDSTTRALGGRFHFVIPKPFTNTLLAKTVKASYGAIALGRRSSFRYQVSIPVTSCRVVFRGETKRLDRVTIANVSRTGMCLQTEGMLPQGAEVDLAFPAHQAQSSLQIKGNVIWSHASGRAGIKLAEGEAEKSGQFAEWLTSILPAAEDFLPAFAPGFVARNAASPTAFALPTSFQQKPWTATA